MTSRVATDASGSLKSRFKGHNLITQLFRFEGTGSLKDRLLTVLIVLVIAVAISSLAVYLPYGGLLCVAVAAFIALGSVFEVVRLFARHPDTMYYRPIAGTCAYIVLALPSLGAIVAAVRSVVYGGIDWKLVYASLVVSGLALMVAQVAEGREKLEGAARYSERYNSSFLILGVCAPQLIVLSGLPMSVPLLWWIMAVVALNDAAAYFVGSSMGKHKMAPGLSPNKSLEGSVAGLVVGAIAGVFFWRALLGDAVATWQLVLASVGMTIVAQAGDLAKSYLKRLRGVKDLGALFPGHGGILDRFDALIAASPVVLLMLILVGLV